MSKRTSTPSRPPDGAQEISDAEVRAAYADGVAEQLAAQAERAKRAKAAAGREQTRLDRMIAEAVSADPAAPVWYARPGVLDLAGAAAATRRTELAVDRAVERHRATLARARARH